MTMNFIDTLTVLNSSIQLNSHSKETEKNILVQCRAIR